MKTYLSQFNKRLKATGIEGENETQYTKFNMTISEIRKTASEKQ